MTQRIAVYNRASAPLGLDLSAFVGALNEYVSAHLGPVWDVSAELHATDRPVPGEWSMVFLDRADVAGALAYHDEEGAPVAKVFVETIQQYKASLTVAASHELAEMLVDPLASFWAATANVQRMVALEVCDPVQGDSLGFDVGGFLMSDFVYPAWFDRGSSGVQFDHQKALSAPFQVHSGGYVIQMSNGSETEQFGDRVIPHPFDSHAARRHLAMEGA